MHNKVNIVQSFTITDIAYLAGIIDGEGCFSMRYRNREIGSGWELSIKITNTNEDIHKWIRKKFDIKNFQSHQDIPTHKPCGVTSIFPKKIDDILEYLIQFLVIKKEQAILFLEARKLTKNRKGKKTGAYMLQMKEIKEKIKGLNYRGVDINKIEAEGNISEIRRL